MTDMERFIAAADALAEALESLMNEREVLDRFNLDQDIDALTAYRAAREAITRGTPPAFATSA